MRTAPTRALLASWCLLALATGSPAHAADGTPPMSATAPAAPTARESAEAKRHFTDGLKLYGEHAFVEALAQFELSYRMGRRPSALRNVAQCHRDLHHFADAYDAYGQLLRDHGPQLSRADRDAVTHAIDELAELSGSVTVTSTEAGASVELDGKPLGATPLGASKRVGLGAHRVVVTKAGFEPFERAVTVESAGAVTVEATLATEVTTGHLAVREQSGDPVDVLVDGKDVGAAPWEGDLPPGDHMLEARGPRFAADARPFTLARKQRLDIVLDATSTMGHVRITTSPASATIRVDGQEVGTGVWDAEVPPGPHHVDVAAPGAPHAVRDLAVVRGQLIVVDIPLASSVDSAERAPDYEGVYVKLNPFGMAGTAGTQLFASGGSTGFHFGLGGALRIGYSFGIFAIEFTVAGMVDHYDATVTASATNSTGYGVDSGDAFAGLGGRVTSHGATTRGTVALAPGVAVHNLSVNNQGGGGNSGNCSTALNPCSNSGDNMHVGYAAPGLMFDGGLLLGTTPGSKFFLGIEGWLDLAPTIYVGPDVNAGLPSSVYFAGRGLKAVSGPQLYVGPTLGVQFGH